MAVVHHPAPHTVIALIDAVPAGGAIATDCDGTIWNGDIGDDVVRAAAADRDHFGSPPLDFDAYTARLTTDYDGACLSACEVLRHADPDVAATALRAHVAANFAARRYFVDALRDAMQRGVQVWFVSASARFAIAIGAEIIDFQPTGMIGIELADEGFRTPWPIGAGKPAAWRAHGLPVADLAFGDSRWDVPLLESARTGVMLIQAAEDPHADDSAAALRPRPVRTRSAT